MAGGRRRVGEDHPRSRGVYFILSMGDDSLEGSSPLARGLHGDPPGPMVLVRIIPARAGFTCRGTPKTVLGRDHPRSRGVYPVADPLATVTAGSSPLARGLHPPDAGHAPARRIIPARAGFTGRTAGTPFTSTDHPRSRGVYCSLRRPTGRRAGSSPLARGLPLTGPGTDAEYRIIPARAGFTRRRRRRRRPHPDHPRSRGVYTSTSTSGEV